MEKGKSEKRKSYASHEIRKEAFRKAAKKQGMKPQMRTNEHR